MKERYQEQLARESANILGDAAETGCAKTTVIVRMLALILAAIMASGCASSLPTSVPAGQPETVAELEAACADRGGLVLERRTGTRIRKPIQPDELVGAGCRR